MRQIVDGFDAVAEDYDEMHDDRRAQLENAQVASMIEWGMSAKGVMALDLGCGTGLALDLVPELLDRGYIGVDRSGAMLARFREKHPHATVVQKDVHRFLPSLPERSIRLVLGLFGALSHFADPWLVLSHTYRVLRPGGRAVWIVYTENRLQEPGYTYENNHDVPAKSYTAIELRRACRVMGLKAQVSGMGYPVELPGLGKVKPNAGRYVVALCERPS